jgi:uncharacterized protein YecE (DUF72 family)
MVQAAARVGCSGWQYKHWRANFYPEGLPQSRWFDYYASKFDTVEINNTFYRLPREDLLRGWAAQVPEDFSFSIKASQKITHFTRLKPESSDAVDYLLRTVDCMGARLGPILFQLPPNMKKDATRLRGFLGLLPADRRYAIEFRHASWFDDEVFDALRERDIAFCVAEQDDFKCPVQSTASWGYLRLHRLDYDASALGEWAKCVSTQTWSETYVYFKHDEGAGSGPPAVDAFVQAHSRLS